VTTQVIVLNGTSSSGKTGIARCLQAILPEPWIVLGIDTLIWSLPVDSVPSPVSATGLTFAADGTVVIDPVFRRLEVAFSAGVAAMVRAGARVLVDDVFLSSAASQRRWQDALDGLEVLWVGVLCEVAVAAERELARGDRVSGLAASQTEVVHLGVSYDLRVDTTRTEALECAREIAAHVG
jgi:chloramphenicol 3-O phosphotransferase